MKENFVERLERSSISRTDLCKMVAERDDKIEHYEIIKNEYSTEREDMCQHLRDLHKDFTHLKSQYKKKCENCSINDSPRVQILISKIEHLDRQIALLETEKIQLKKEAENGTDNYSDLYREWANTELDCKERWCELVECDKARKEYELRVKSLELKLSLLKGIVNG